MVEALMWILMRALAQRLFMLSIAYCSGHSKAAPGYKLDHVYYTKGLPRSHRHCCLLVFSVFRRRSGCLLILSSDLRPSACC